MTTWPLWSSAIAATLLFASDTSWAAPQTRVRLLLSAEAVAGGVTVWAGIELRMPPGWHTYWRNPGDAGQATEITWQLPAGVRAGAIHWPVPEKMVDPPLTTYVYSSNVVLLVPIEVSSETPLGAIDLKVDVSWMECGELCLPARTTVQSGLVIGRVSKISSEAALLDRWKACLPKSPGPESAITAQWEAETSPETRPLLIHARIRESGGALDFYPFSGSGFAVEGTTQTITEGATGAMIRKVVRRTRPDWPVEIGGLVVGGNAGKSGRTAVEVTLRPPAVP